MKRDSDEKRCRLYFKFNFPKIVFPGMTSPMVSGVLTQAAITTGQSFYWWQIRKDNLALPGGG